MSIMLLRCKYHPKIKDIFKTADIYYYNNDQLYNIPISKKDNIIQTLIDLNVYVKEVVDFEPVEQKPV